MMTSPSSRRVAYLVNQYPKVSHTFIRREIQELERQGVAVVRIAVRGWADPVVDDEDGRERERTRFVLQAGMLGLAVALARAMGTRPLRLLRVFHLATRMARGADRSLPFHWIYAAEACVVARWLEETGVSHLHAHFGTNPAEVAMLASMLSDVPYSFTVHGPEEFDHPKAIGLSEKMNRARFVVAISSFGRSQLYRWLDQTQWCKVQVVHCGLDEQFHLGTEVDANVAAQLVCVGRLCEQKGQLLLLDAMRRVFDTGRRFTLVLAGDGEMRAVVEHRCRELGLDGHVRITGWISSSQVREELLGARAMVLPSFAEGLPVVLMEAMALGRPVLSTFVAGIPELVRSGEDGWLVPAGDAEALSRAIVACLDATPERLSAMGKAARERAVARHAIGPQAARLAELMTAGLQA